MKSSTWLPIAPRHSICEIAGFKLERRGFDDAHLAVRGAIVQHREAAATQTRVDPQHMPECTVRIGTAFFALAD